MPLSPQGRAQAWALAGRLAAEDLDTICASDLQRAWQTAEVIAAPHGLAVRAESRLREVDLGAWEGLTYDEIKQRYPQTLAAWQAHPLITTPPDGESLAQVAARVGEALDDIAQTYQGQAVLLVAHGGSLQVLLCLVLGLVPQARWQFRLNPGSLSELYLYDEKTAILTLLNDTCHLAEVENDR
jgi:alpha-ribazole phosphatase